MASDSSTGTPLFPDFIRFLFSTKPKFDCYFVVGNKTQGKPERIGAVKLMLMAHSEIFRLQLEDSDLKEKDDVPVKDVHPDTFKGMLKYVYGHDTTTDMCFDEADNLLYVAEKYMIKTLKDKLAMRLMNLLNPDNLCSLLNNPACYTHLELNSAITEILRHETDRVLSSSQFLWVNTEGFLKILEQDALAVPEIELWRAAIKWAKHRADSEDGQLIRQQISGLTQHLRPCALTTVEICEVIPEDFFNSDEIVAVCRSISKKEDPQGLNDFSNKTEPRKIIQTKTQNEIKLSENGSICSNAEYNLTLLTKQQAIELLPLECQAKPRSDDMNPVNWTYKVECTTTITKVVNPYNSDSSSTIEPPLTVTLITNVKFGEKFEFSLAVDGKNITLLPDTKYTIKIKMAGNHMRYYRRDNYKISNDYMVLTTTIGGDGNSYYYFPSTKIQYRITSVE